MRERGIDISSRQSRHFSAVAGQQFDYAVSLCDRVREVCPDFPGPPHLVHWSIPDPSAGGGSDAETYSAFRALAADLETRIGFLLSRIAASAQEAGQPVPGAAGGRPAPRTGQTARGRPAVIDGTGQRDDATLPPEAAVPGRPQAGLATVLREWGRRLPRFRLPPPTSRCCAGSAWIGEAGWTTASSRTRSSCATCCPARPPSWRSSRLAGPGAPRRAGGRSRVIVPGLASILALSVLFLAGTPPMWVRRRRRGGRRSRRSGGPGRLVVRPGRAGKPAAGSRFQRARWAAYALAGGAAAATIGPWLVLVLLGCGAIELAVRHHARSAGPRAIVLLPLLTARAARAAGPARAIAAAAGAGVLLPVAWTALKVGALSFGAVVIIPLMQADATSHHWMTSAQFLNGVALGQVTPGSAILLARALSQPWQYAVLAAAAVLLLALHRGVVLTLLAAGATGVIIALAGGPLPH